MSPTDETQHLIVLPERDGAEDLAEELEAEGLAAAHDGWYDPDPHD